jgi:glycosyltransferase involved in cell wall biosynthesis
MKILLDVRTLHATHLTGVPTYTKYIVEHLLKNPEAHEYVLFSNTFRSSESLIRRFSLPEDRVREVNWHIPNRPLNFFSAWLNAPKIRIPSVELAFSPHIHPISVPRGTPHVVTIHDLAFSRFPGYFSLKERLWHALPRPRTLAKRADHIIAVSETTKRDLVEHWKLPEEKVTVVYPGAHDCIPEDRLGDVSRVQDFTNPFVLFTGTLEPRKNIEGLVVAFEILKNDSAMKDMNLVIVGKPGWLYKPILHRIARSKNRRDIVVWGYASDSELQELYRRASLFAYPSFFEGFVFPPLHAQLLGCPVVVSEGGVFRETLAGSARMVDQRNAESIAEGMREVLRNAEFRARLVARGKENVARFTWSAAAERTLQVFQNTAHRLK